MDASAYADDLRLAHVLADQVERITMDRFRASDLAVESKPDLTPVTEADRDCEAAIRAQLARARTRDAVIGEEFEPTGHSQRQWIIDPIDGTKNYVRGVPVWATLIGLVEDGECVMGLVAAPALGRRWWAAKGAGAWTGRSLAKAEQIHVSQVGRVEDSSFSYSSIDGWRQHGRGMSFLRLTSEVWRTRAYGDFWSYMLVAEGAVDAAADAAVSAAYGSSGERCMAISACVAVGPIADDLVAKITERARTIRTGDGTRDSDMGPLVTAAHRDKVTKYVEKGIAEGATIATVALAVGTGVAVGQSGGSHPATVPAGSVTLTSCHILLPADGYPTPALLQRLR